MRLTGERAGSDFEREKAYHKGVTPTGLEFTGEGIAVRLYEGTQNVKYAHLQDLYVGAKSGRIGVQVYGKDTDDTYAPWSDCVFRNITVEGGSEAGFEVRGNVFLSEFHNIRSFGAGGDGIRVRGRSGNNYFGFLRAKYAGGDGIRIETHGGGTFHQLYANFCGGDGIHVGPNVSQNQFGYVYGETNGGVGVRVNSSEDRFRHIRGRDNEDGAVALELCSGTRIGTVVASQTDVRIGTLANARIDRISTVRGAGIDTSESKLTQDAVITDVSNDGSGPDRFHAATLTDGGSGTVRWNFDTLYTSRPALAFGRRGGGIERLDFVPKAGGRLYRGVDITVAEPGSTIDVQAHPRG